MLIKWWGSGIRAAPSRIADQDSVQYLVAHGPWSNLQYMVVPQIERMLRKYGDTETVILAKSTKAEGRKKPLQVLVDFLSRSPETAFHVETDSGRSAPQEVLQNKRRVSTVCKFKGLEVDAVVLFGFDDFAEALPDNENFPLRLFNTFYVGATRARKQVLLVQFNKAPYVTIRCAVSQNPVYDAASTYQVTNMLQHVPFSPALAELVASDNLSTNNNTYSGGIISPVDLRPLQIIEGRRAGDLEDIAAVLGIVIEFKLMQLFGFSLKQLLGGMRLWDAAYGTDDFGKANTSDVSLRTYLRQEWDRQTSPTSCSWPDLLRAALASFTMDTGYIHQWRQIGDKMNTIPQDPLNQLVRNTLCLLESICEKHFPRAKSDSCLGGERKREDVCGAQIKRLQGVGIQFQTLVEITKSTSPIFASHPQISRRVDGLEGLIDILLGGKVLIELKVSTAMQEAYIHQTACYAALGQCMKPSLIVEHAYLVNPAAGQASCVRLSAGKANEYLLRMISRKASLKLEESEELVRVLSRKRSRNE